MSRRPTRECELCQFDCRETQTIILVGDQVTLETCDHCFAQQLKEIVAHWMASPERTALAARLKEWRATEKAKARQAENAPLLHHEAGVDLSPADFQCRTSAGQTEIALFRREGKLITVRWDLLTPEFRAAIQTPSVRSK